MLQSSYMFVVSVVVAKIKILRPEKLLEKVWRNSKIWEKHGFKICDLIIRYLRVPVMFKD